MILLLVLLLLFGSAYAADLRGIQFFNSDPFLCDGEIRIKEWRNNTGGTIFLKSLTVTTGMIKNATGDLQAIVVRASDNSWLTLTGWDRYANPNASISKVYNFAPDWWEVRSDDYLYMSYFCKGFDATGAPRSDYIAHFIVVGTYTVGP